MTPVKTPPRFRCAFCQKVATKGAMTRHEKRCFFNPERMCNLCGNVGYTTSGYWGFPESIQDHDCTFCAASEKARVEVVDIFLHCEKIGATVSPTIANFVLAMKAKGEFDEYRNQAIRVRAAALAHLEEC